MRGSKLWTIPAKPLRNVWYLHAGRGTCNYVYVTFWVRKDIIIYNIIQSPECLDGIPYLISHLLRHNFQYDEHIIIFTCALAFKDQPSYLVSTEDLGDFSIWYFWIPSPKDSCHGGLDVVEVPRWQYSFRPGDKIGDEHKETMIEKDRIRGVI